MEDPIQAEIILYQSEGANVPVQVYYKDETLWVSQGAMADLFDVSVSTISEHLINIFASGELQKASSTSFSGFSGKTSSKGGRPKTYYNLDAVIAVGYRVNSMRATRFRQWATATLKEYITKGFVLNDDMLKNGRPFGKDYFDELLARIRDIRASERLLDGFLTFSGREVLKGLGNRNKKTADKIAKERFHEFQKLQDKTYENDFELMVKHMNGKA